MKDFTDSREVVMVATKIGDAVPAVWSGEMKNVGISGDMPG